MRQNVFGEAASDPLQMLFRLCICNCIKHEIPNRVGVSHERNKDDPLFDIFVYEIALQMLFGFRQCGIRYAQLALLYKSGEPLLQRIFAVGLKMAV